jgi:hypothetical protein
MNSRQEERVPGIGRAFPEAVADIVNLGEPTPIEEPALVAYEREEVCREESMPRPIDMNDKLAQYDVTIKHVHNGFIVNVGCQTFVFESFNKMTTYMAMYYDDPRGTYEKHYKGELLKQYL